MSDFGEIDEVHEGLYIGACWPLLNFNKIKKEGITAIVNLMEREKYSLPDNEYFYLHEGISDDYYTSHESLKRILNFIDKHIQNGKVLVHCSMGVSRSGGVVVAWLLKEHPNWTWDDAVQYVKRSHGIYPAIEIKQSILDYLESIQRKRRD